MNEPTAKSTYRCYKCDKIFTTHSELANHSLSIHTSSSSNICVKTPFSKVNLPNQYSSVQLNSVSTSETSNLSCFKCDNVFEQFCDLSEHIKTYHNPCQFYPCDECELAFPTMLFLETHIESEHNSPLPQCDGLMQEIYEFTDISASPPKTVRSANYSLNKKKQMNEIQKDANLKDFDVSVNNADQNVTIKCSSGFYTQVALPSFATLAKSTVFTKSKIAISVDEVSITKDLSGLDSNRLMHFSFMNELKDVGGVTVHLHHSTRSIQIQGSHIMPDSTRAALWFVNNVTLTRFKDQAKAKKFAIKSFNEAAKKLPDTQISENAQQFANCCQSCFSIFNTKSKPSICNFCMKYFHKTNCLKDHTMICPMSSKSASHSQHQTARSSPISSLSPVTTVTDSSSYNANLSSLQSQSSTFQSMPLNYSSAIPTANHSLSSNRSLPFPMPSMQGLQTSLTFVPSTTTIIPSSDIASSANSKSLPGPTTSSNQNLKRKTANAKKNQIPTNPQDIKIEFLQTELAAAQTRIVLLDASLKDKEQMCSVLLARVKVFEERENQKTFQTYFPDNAPRTRTTETSSSACHSHTSSSS